MAVDVKVIPSRIFLDMGMVCIQAEVPPYFEYVLTDAKAKAIITKYADDSTFRADAATALARVKRGQWSLRVSVPMTALIGGASLREGVSLP